eukprot:149358_1
MVTISLRKTIYAVVVILILLEISLQIFSTNMTIVPTKINFVTVPTISISNQQLQQDIIDKFMMELCKVNYDGIEDIFVENYIFEKFSYNLLSNSLYNNSILFVGDSVVQLSYEFIVSELNKSNDTINSYFIYKENNQFPWDTVNYNTFYDGNVFMNLTFYHHWILREPSIYKEMLTKFIYNTLHIKYNVIYINFASTHLFHLFPWRELNMNMLLNLETYFDEIINISSQLKVKCIIFRSAQSICSKKYTAKYKLAVTYFNYLKNNISTTNITNSTINDCYDKYSINATKIYLNYSYNNFNNYNDFIINGYDLCSYKWTLTNDGSSNLNKRIKQYIDYKRFQLKNKLKLFYLNIFKVYFERCEFTPINDGRHYRKLQPIQSMTLLNTIHNFC